MSSPSCSISIMVARTDISFMMHTIPHFLRACDFPFTQRILAVDTAPLSGDKVNCAGGTMQKLRVCCDYLMANGIINKVVDIDYSDIYRDKVYSKHFGKSLRLTHNYKGYPILGSIFSIEEVESDYLLRIDSDMLLHQATGYSWIKEGIKLLQDTPDLIAVRPLAGPPSGDGDIYAGAPYAKDPRGFYSYKFFGSRVYLIDRKRFDQLLPIPVLWKPGGRRLLNCLPNYLKTLFDHVKGKGCLDSWEVMVSKRLERTDYIRATMNSPKAWSIHPKTRSKDFIDNLPKIIKKIESGWYPPQQAGYNDLKLQYWL